MCCFFQNCTRSTNSNYNTCINNEYKKTRNCNFQCNSTSNYPLQNNCYYNRFNSNFCSKNRSPFPKNYIYGHAYTPNQNFNEIFSAEDGLIHGSLFPELVSPYQPGQSMEFINYLKQTDNEGDDIYV